MVDSLLSMSIYFALCFLKMIVTVVQWLNAHIYMDQLYKNKNIKASSAVRQEFGI